MQLKRSSSNAGTERIGSTQSFTITCSKCKSEIPLTEALAQPLILAEVEKVRQEAAEISVALRAREEELARRLASIDQVEVQLNDRAKQFEDTVRERVRTEREAIVKAAEKKAAEASAARIQAADRELAEEREKVARAEQSELAVRKERRLLEEQKRKIELEVERTLQHERVRIREDTLREEGETHQLKVAERDKVILDLKRQIDQLRQRSDVGAIQIRGEVQEVELESLLHAAFPKDRIEPVPGGVAGGDVHHTVIGNGGVVCGKIVYESKRTREFSQQWLPKLRADQRAAGAQFAILVSRNLPKGVTDFDLVDNVWVTSLRCVRPLALALRQVLTEISVAKLAVEERDGASARVHEYVTGIRFQQRISALVEAVMAQTKDDEAERRSFHRQFSRRETRREVMVVQLAGLLGDLGGLTNSLPEISGFPPRLLHGSEPDEELPGCAHE